MKRLTALFDACFRIQREACAAAGRHIPLIVENVRGAQKWVGRAKWHYGSYYLWGDVPALMPMTRTMRIAKRAGHDWNRFKETGEVSPHWKTNGQDHASRFADKPQTMSDSKRKAASALIAKIPLVLARHIAATFYPRFT